jgi:hypothetical protein
MVGGMMNDRQLEALERALKLHARAKQISDEDLAGWMGYLQRRFRLSDGELHQVRDRAAILARWADRKVTELLSTLPEGSG